MWLTNEESVFFELPQEYELEQMFLKRKTKDWILISEDTSGRTYKYTQRYRLGDEEKSDD